MASTISSLRSNASTKFDWAITDFSTINSHEGLYSDVFSVGGFEWQVQIYPKGGEDVYQHLSLYLIPMDPDNLPTAKLTARIHNQLDHKNSKRKEFKHKFTEDTMVGWGWAEFMPLSKLMNPDKGYLLNGRCLLKIKVVCETTEDDDDVSETVDESNPETDTQSVQGDNDSEVGFVEVKEELEDIEGFHMLNLSDNHEG